MFAQLSTDLPLLPFKQRNAAFDRFFYDTGSLTPDEIRKLAPTVDREGCIIVVPPARQGSEIRHYRKALRFMTAEGDSIRAIVVAGVGSSVVGTAALARNVADVLDADVAGIVTGFGVLDVLSEALGGWFLFRVADCVKMNIEREAETFSNPLPQRSRALPAAGPEAALAQAGSRGLVNSSLERLLPGSDDVATLLDVLIARPKQLTLLLGHSKGNLLIDFVLEQMVREMDGLPHPLYEALHVVTLGAVVDLPDQFRHRHQYLGGSDLLGKINSTARPIPFEVIEGVSHHLNPAYPNHMSVRDVLTPLLPELR